ncbi:hypothetical protein [Solibacillus sp. FSL K6-1523]|uniref:hypothetical protein n=1 Tax=Solibacillus sp. FSL K6-1523 TaxID=2921471 RepID=UPI0030FB1598
MSSYYDNELFEHLTTIGIAKFTVITTPDNYIECINKKFPFKDGKVDFVGLKNKRYVESDQNSISMDVVNFVSTLIQDNVCTKNERIVYVGDSLTDNEYEFYLYDLLKILPYLVNEIPQHHYFLFNDSMKLINVSFENEIQFGIL